MSSDLQIGAGKVTAEAVDAPQYLHEVTGPPKLGMHAQLLLNNVFANEQCTL